MFQDGHAGAAFSRGAPKRPARHYRHFTIITTLLRDVHGSRMIGDRHKLRAEDVSVVTTMRSEATAVRFCTRLFSLIALTFAVPSARAQGETFTATAALKGSGGATVSTPITVSIRQYMSDGDREEMLAALKKSMSQALAFLGKEEITGSIQIGGGR